MQKREWARARKRSVKGMQAWTLGELRHRVTVHIAVAQEHSRCGSFDEANRRLDLAEDAYQVLAQRLKARAAKQGRR